MKAFALTALLLLIVCTAAAQEPRKLPDDLAPAFRPPANADGKGYRSPLKFNDGTPVKTPADWQKRRQEIRAAWLDAIGEWPPLLTKPKIEYLAKERRGNITQHRIKIEVAPGRFNDQAYLLIPDGDGPFPAVVAVFYDSKTSIGDGKAKNLDYAWQLAQRGFVTLAVGSPPESYFPNKDKGSLQPLSYHAYVAANLYNILASLKQVDSRRIGIVGHSYGGKWALFASCLDDRYACAVWSDPGIVFDEQRANVNYWERWYLGHEPGQKSRQPGIPNAMNPRTGAYKKLIEAGHDLHELHALMAPRPFLVSGGSEDQRERWQALAHSVAVNRLLGYEDRVGMTNRPGHNPSAADNAVVYRFFEHWLKAP